MDLIRTADTQPQIDAVAAALEAADTIALDTEFVREKTYYPQLCLIQIATADLTACIDCLAGLSLDRALDALNGAGRAWILHSARQDLEVMWNLRQVVPARLIDTQIAGALLGMPPQTSLGNLLSDVIGVDLAKDQTRADWSRRPLPAAAVDYAIDDVRHLQAAWDVLESRLAAAGRLAWFEEECARVLAMSPTSTAAEIVERIRGIGSLSQAQQTAALALTEWREARAAARDRPRRWILPDDQLVRIARARPQTEAELGAVADLPKNLVERHAGALIAAIAAGPSAPLPPALANSGQQRMPDKARVREIQAIIRERAEQLGIAAEFLATRRDAAALESGNVPAHMARGWRSEILADLIGG